MAKADSFVRVFLEINLMEKLREAAARDDRTMTSMISHLVRRGLEELEEKEAARMRRLEGKV